MNGGKAVQLSQFPIDQLSGILIVLVCDKRIFVVKQPKFTRI